MELAGMPPEALDTDRTLSATLAGGPFVLGYQFDFDSVRGDGCVMHPLRAAVLSGGGKGGSEGLFDAQGVICNLPILSKAAGASGFFNVTPDPDGVLRRVPLVIRHKDALYPGLALAVYLRARGGDTVVETGRKGSKDCGLNDRTIPLDRRANLVVNFAAATALFPTFAYKLLDGTADPALLKGKIVLVGPPPRD
jgi:adenylate cyclase